MSNLRKAFEDWAKDNEYDISFVLKAPCYVYVCEKTDAAWDGYKAAHEGAEAELQIKIDELQRELDMYEAEDYNRQQGD